MQRTAASPAPFRPGGGGKVTVEGKQLLVELGVGQQGLVHWGGPLKRGR
jgi:hypothetical protein